MWQCLLDNHVKYISTSRRLKIPYFACVSLPLSAFTVPLSSFPFLLKPAFDSRAGAGASGSGGCPRDVCAESRFFWATCFVTMAPILTHNVLRRGIWTAMLRSASVRDEWFRRNWDTELGPWKKSWWHCCDSWSSICCFISPVVGTRSIRCFEEVDYENLLGRLVVATCDLVMSKLPPAIELLKLQEPLE